MTSSPRDRLRDAFSDLAEGRLDNAGRAFTALSAHAAVRADAQRGLAAIHWRTGRLGDAIGLLRAATVSDPANADAHADLALVLTVNGQRDEAAPEWERALKLRPENSDLWHNYGKVLADLNKHTAAREAFEQSLRLKPGRPTTLAFLARSMMALEESTAAEKVWRQALEIAPTLPEAWQGLAEVQFGKGDLPAALETYQRGVAAIPQSADLHLGLGQLLEDLADAAGAEQAFRKALELRPGWALALEALLTLTRGRATPELITQARSAFDDLRRPPQDRANIGFGLGKVLDARKEFSEAFAVWQIANDARRAQVGAFDRQRSTDRFDRTIRAFNAERMAQFAGQGSEDERPVFVVGMPRSGTTLVEQIIAAHPRAKGLGELADIGRIVRGLPRRAGTIQRWPEALSSIDGAALHDAAAEYVRVIENRDGGTALRLVDKAPMNFLHCGVIALMFPRARIIWCRRDPRDVCLSIFGENFALEQKFATSLADLGHYFRDHMRLMRHWRSVIPDRITECSYEDLVADPEPQARRLIEAIGLEWDPACLRFHEQTRAVLTPSRWQVRQPMYSSSVQRWRNYEPWLAPLLESLGDEAKP